MAKDYRCPNCGSENTRSVPLIYAEGHYAGSQVTKEVIGQTIQQETTTYADGHEETREVSRTPIYGDVKRSAEGSTDLAKQITPPTEPKPRGKYKISGTVFDSTVHAGCSSIGCLIPVIIFVAIGKYYLFPEISISWSTYALVIAAIVAYFVIDGYKTGKKEKQRRIEANINEEQFFAKRMKRYKQKKYEWDHAYMCMRCGHIFILDDDGVSKEYVADDIVEGPWVCSRCGYIYDGYDIAEEDDDYCCPICHGPKSGFEVKSEQ